MKIKIIRELHIYLILIILLLCYKFTAVNNELYLFWQPIIDNLILLLFLLGNLFTSKKWSWIGKKIIYTLIIILLINTYAILFGISIEWYSKWYYIPLISSVCSIVLITTMKLIQLIYKSHTKQNYGKNNHT